MEQRLALAEAAQTGDIEALYALLRQNPYLLEDIDKIPFVDTPLHTAASAGCTHFAIEILSLKPSFAKKLNPDGYSPIDLALTCRQSQTVKQLICCDPELIRVKSKERFTPLHYVAEMDDADLLAEFLVRCPKSIEDLTVRGETAIHIAVRNAKMRVFKVLLGWLSEANLEQILNWQDDKGDTVLHIATFTNNLEAVKLLMKKRRINRNKKNEEGLTALDIAGGLPNAEDKRSLAKRLRGTVAKRFSAYNENLADRFISISEESCRRKFLRLLSLLKASGGDDIVSEKTRQALLVVFVLIATTTYQAMLTPPSSLTQEIPDPHNYRFDLQLRGLYPKKTNPYLHGFLLVNTGAFLVSVLSMCTLFKSDALGLRTWMKTSLACLVLGYAMGVVSYSQLDTVGLSIVEFCFFQFILILINK